MSENVPLPSSLHFMDTTEFKLFVLRRWATVPSAHSFVNTRNRELLQVHPQLCGQKNAVLPFVDVLRNLKCWDRVAVDSLCSKLLQDARADRIILPNLFTCELKIGFQQNVQEEDAIFTDLCTQLAFKPTFPEPNFEMDDFSNVQYRIVDMFCSQMQLLLNGRDPLATAKALLTDGSKPVYTLRKAADQTNMPICQTAVSYVMRHRLEKQSGKKSQKVLNAAPDPLNEHVAVYSSFVDNLHQMHCIVEDALQPAECVNKLCACVAKRLGSVLTARKYQCAITRAVELMNDQMRVVVENLSVVHRIAGNTPKASASRGGSRIGRNSLVALECLLDRMQCFLERCSPAEVASPLSRTPQPDDITQLPDLSTLLLSPELPVVETQETTANTCTPEVQQVTEKAIATFINDRTPQLDSEQSDRSEAIKAALAYEPSGSHDGQTTPGDTPNRRPFRERNANCGADDSNHGVTPHRLKSHASVPSKRPLKKKLLVDDNEEVKKKPKVQSVVPKKTTKSKKSNQPTLQGQKTMLNFFTRV